MAPRGPPTRHIAPSSASRRLPPSSAPAGTRTATRRGCRARPTPLQQLQGTTTSKPLPSQAGQQTTKSADPAGEEGREEPGRAREGASDLLISAGMAAAIECVHSPPCMSACPPARHITNTPAIRPGPPIAWRLTISRRPLHMGQAGARLPGWAPLPPHCRQVSCTCRVMLRRPPSAASLKSSCSTASRSGGRCSVPPLLVLLLSLPPWRLLPPYRASSYRCRCRSSDSTRNAVEMACSGSKAETMQVDKTTCSCGLCCSKSGARHVECHPSPARGRTVKRSVAVEEGLTSGCHCLARRRKARLTSSLLAARGRPSVW